MTFVDYKTTLEAINTAAVMGEFEDKGIKETYLRLLDDIYGSASRKYNLPTIAQS